MDPDDRVLALALKQARERVRESQKQFGARIGVDQATISRWEDYGPRTGGARSLIKHLLAAAKRKSVRG